MAMPIPTETRQRRLVRDVVYEQFRDGIVSGELAAGARLDDAWLQEWLGASRTPIREAVDRLSRDGLLDVQPQRGTHVAPLDVDSALHRLRVFRVFVLAAAAEIVSRREPDLDAALETQEQTLDASAVDAAVLIDTPVVFVAAYGNELLIRLTHDLELHVRRAVIAAAAAAARSALALEPLRAAVQAARAHDAASATAELGAFFDAVEDMIQSALHSGAAA
jgi:DNA-binding GntR family transcriptional regulator